MKKFKRFAAALLSVFCLLSAMALPASAEGFEYSWDQDLTNNPNGPHCKAYFMLNLDTDTVVYSNNADEQLPMASLTKIMTYIVAYETIPDLENTLITIPQSVVDELVGTGSSVAEFSVGETFTGLDMLYLMMVPSGNNAALTLAKYVDQLYAEGKLDTSSQEESASSGEESASGEEGSEASPSSEEAASADDPEASSASQASAEAGYVAPAYGEEGFDGSDYTGRSYFVQLMNEKAAELGCTNTHLPIPMACTTRITIPVPGI